jgi:hypothetical protein
MWEIESGPTTQQQPPGGFDGSWHRWELRQRARETFVVVKIAGHSYFESDTMTDRSRRAVATDERSEVERVLGWDLPPRVVEIATRGEPTITIRDPR